MEFFAVAYIDEDNIQTTTIWTTLEKAQADFDKVSLNPDDIGAAWTKAIIKVKEGESFGGTVATFADTWDGGGEVVKHEERDRDLEESANRIKMFEEFEQVEEASGKYPELDALVLPIANETYNKIIDAVKGVQSKMPYKEQYVLEEVVLDLEKRI